ncbi:MAG TPA: Rpn family recombination-promoting nuclease/putative transposase, partial [Leptospiraceae bacterium]|nr:Rpn family recombination-promoting nuclease/putative transposase [Leptospiraceae bacterium]
MQLLPLNNDFVFKAVFAQNPDLLKDLLNSFPEFSGEKRISNLKVLNPELPKKFHRDKLSILDISAEDISGNKFLIEMQAAPQKEFPKRVLLYWSKIYSRSLTKGKQYQKLPKVYSFNFLNFSLYPEEKEFLFQFRVLETKHLFPLTEDLEMNIIELPKFLKELGDLQCEFETWLYLLKKAEKLKGGEMKTLEKKNPKIRKAISELKTISLSRKNRELYEMRQKAEYDYNSNMYGAYEDGRKEGREEGIELARDALYLSIQLTLESRFHSKGLALMSSVKKHKDLDFLKKLLEVSLKCTDLNEV